VAPLPEIAVVIPCYDLGDSVEAAVDSVLGQTRAAAEIVVVDDGSTDVRTRQVLARLERPRTRVVRIPHGGVAVARNHGVGLTRAPYVVLLDADDVLGERYLEPLAGRLDADPGLAFVSCAVQAFEGARYRWTPPPTTAVATLTRGSVHVSSMFRRSLWDAVGGFDPGLPAYEDLDFWLRAMRLGFRGETIEGPLLHYRVRADSRYRRGIEAATYRQAMQRILERQRAVLDTHGLEVLAEKEAFLCDVRAYQEGLRRQRQTLLAELAQVDGEIAAARAATLAEPTSAGAGRAPAWAESPLKRAVEAFLDERRWLVRGRVVVVADRAWALDGLAVPRWDEGATRAAEERRLLDTATGLAAGSADCLVALLLAAAPATGTTLAPLVAALEPGGTLLVVAPAAEGARVAEEAGGADRAAAAMAAALADVLPLDAFEVDVREGGLVTACARRPGGARLPRLRFWRRPEPLGPAPGGLVLAYHRVAALSPDTHRLCVSPSRFHEHMRYLREHCTPLPLLELVLAARAGALPPRAVAVTFDDGYLDALTTAAPILVAERVPATFFVNTEQPAEPHEAWHDTVERILLGDADLPPRLELPPLSLAVRTAAQRSQALMTLHGVLLAASVAERARLLEALARWSGRAWPPRPERRVLLADEILALSRMPGCEIGSHSAHHLLLPRHDAALQRAELRQAKEWLETLLDRAIVAFAYPFGEHTDALAELVRRTPYLLAATVEPGLVTAATDAMRLPRLEVADGDAAALAASLERAFAGEAVRSPTGMSHMAEPAGAGVATDARDRAWEENDRAARHEYEQGATRLSARPQFLIVDPSSRCNARCVMCPVSFRAPGDRGVDLARAIFDKIAPLIATASQVNLFSTGEPTIARDIEHFVAETRRLANGRTVVWLSTNGKRLPPALLEPLVAPRMGLQFSVDGGTKEVFEPIRRGIGFEELRASLALAQRRRGALRYPMLSFSCTISKRNVHDLANIFRLAQEYGVDYVSFYEEDPEVPEEEAFALDASDRPTFEAQRAAIDATGIRYSNGLTFRGADGLRAVTPEPPPSPPALHCRAPWSVLHVRADGIVRTCCTLRTPMGDLSRQSVDEVWNGPAYVALRRAFVQQSGIPGTCYRCTDPLRTWTPDPATAPTDVQRL
jgi:peptidoglycan/xylan/chitin deacetylase (PgdA/CDA1 family)/MoaA/NifB/PqqE/SkfB family radical SAM enzyme/GT2 family glycosyltransferase